jgi:hypothetical protein
MWNRKIVAFVSPAEALQNVQQRRVAMPQIGQGNPVITQITVVECDEGKQEEVLGVMQDRARFMARQPGFISITLHRSRMAVGW